MATAQDVAKKIAKKSCTYMTVRKKYDPELWEELTEVTQNGSNDLQYYLKKEGFELSITPGYLENCEGNVFRINTIGREDPNERLNRMIEERKSEWF